MNNKFLKNMWDIEDTGYDIAELEEILRKNLFYEELPSDESSIIIKKRYQPGIVEINYKTSSPRLDMSFVVNFGAGKSYEGDFEVYPQFKGYGTKLVKAREEFCKDIGIEQVILSNVDRNAKGFWEKMGYVNNSKRLS